MAKLTLSVDEHVVARAKRYAREHGTSVSGLVEKMLDLAAAPRDIARGTPRVLARLRGSINRGSVRDYHRHLERKHR